MAIVRTSVPGSSYDSVYIDALVWGGTAWDPASGEITYHFGEAIDFSDASSVHGAGRISLDSSGLDAWSIAEEDAFSVCPKPVFQRQRVDLQGSLPVAEHLGRSVRAFRTRLPSQKPQKSRKKPPFGATFDDDKANARRRGAGRAVTFVLECRARTAPGSPVRDISRGLAAGDIGARTAPGQAPARMFPMFAVTGT